MKQVFLRTGNNYDRAKASRETWFKCTGKTMTQQSGKDEADINTIVRRFGLTGVMPQSVKVPRFADYEDVFDFQSAQNAVIAAQAAFMEVPAAVRSRFNNSPQLFLEFCSDIANLDEMRKLGLAKPAPAAPNAPGAAISPPSGGQPTAGGGTVVT